ncbi:MAG: type II toxin-antitoxin system RelE/ParE family toxin [Chloroflexota bacterium]|nr:type II toxin-antitoxin system RelE/ParE family toxin [Chloroflexota bacterium]
MSSSGAYTVYVTENVQRQDLPALDAGDRTRARAKMATLSVQPNRHPALRGALAGLRSVRAGQLRIIFAVDDERRTVTVIAVGRRRAQERRDVYADTARRIDRADRPDGTPNKRRHEGA